MLDSLNDTGISAENDQYRGAFAVFACLDVILHSKRWQNAEGSNFTEIRIPAKRALAAAPGERQAAIEFQ
jgi:uncharacterized membrane protein